MSRYTVSVGDTNEPANLLLLKSDIHKCFDKRWIVIVPKVPRAVAGVEVAEPPRFVAHILSKDAAELWHTHHNTLVQYLNIDSAPFLFARFAWAILLSVKRFVTANVTRHVIRAVVSTQSIGGNETQGTKYESQFLQGQELNNLFGGGGSKAATPMKRKAQGGSAVDDDDDDDDKSSSEEGIWDTNVMDVRAERGKRGDRNRQMKLSLTPRRF
jgi:hypothetical protein